MFHIIYGAILEVISSKLSELNIFSLTKTRFNGGPPKISP